MNARNHYGRCKWLGKITAVLLIAWLLTITLLIDQILKANSNIFHDKSEPFEENAKRLQKLSSSFDRLQKQNSVLRSIITG